MKIIIATAILSLCLIGCSNQDTTTNDATEVVSHAVPIIEEQIVVEPTYVNNTVARDAEYKRRAIIRDEFLAAAKSLVTQADLKEHNLLYDFIAERSFLALPVPGSVLPVEDFSEKYFAIVVILPEDDKLGNPWNGILTSIGASSAYDDHGMLMIISPDETESKESMGIALLHEAYHAYATTFSEVRANTAEDFCRGEVDTHEFVSELTFKLHPRVKDLVDETASYIQSEDEDGVITVHSTGAIMDFVDSRIDKAYGRTVTSQSERGALVVDTFYLANFRSIDNVYPSDQRKDAKISFLKDYLERSGNAQWQH